jgi:hypothetical protein
MGLDVASIPFAAVWHRIRLPPGKSDLVSHQNDLDGSEITYNTQAPEEGHFDQSHQDTDAGWQ